MLYDKNVRRTQLAISILIAISRIIFYCLRHILIQNRLLNIQFWFLLNSSSAKNQHYWLFKNALSAIKMFFRDYGFGFLVLGFVILEIYYVRKREDFLAFAWFARNIEIWCVSWGQMSWLFLYHIAEIKLKLEMLDDFLAFLSKRLIAESLIWF